MTTGHLLGHLRPLDSIQLGRLVLHTKHPHQDFIDPFGLQPSHPEFSRNSRSDFTETQKFSKSSSLRPYLGSGFSITYERQNSGFATLSAPLATTHDLNNSGAWFERACAVPDTRKFLERAMNNRSNVYLVVGFRTVHGGSLVKGSTWKKGQTIAGQLPMQLLTGVPAMATPGAGGSVDVGKDRELAFQAPGEQVFAVIYRKIRFKRFSSRTVANMFLEPTNRWKSCWDWRGMEEEVEDGDDDDDMVEANLTDGSDLDDDDDDDDDSDDDDDDDSDNDNEDGVSEDETEYPRVIQPGISKAPESPAADHPYVAPPSRIDMVNTISVCQSAKHLSSPLHSPESHESTPTPPGVATGANSVPAHPTPVPEPHQVQKLMGMSLGTKVDITILFFTFVWTLVYYFGGRMFSSGWWYIDGVWSYA